MPVTRALSHLLLALVFVASAAACGGDDNDSSGPGGDTGQADAGDVLPDAIDDAGDTSLDAADGGDGGDIGPDATDGGTDTDGGTPPQTVVACDNPTTAPSDGAICSVTPGASNLVLLQGTVLGADAAYETGYVLVDRSGANAQITCVGCDCADSADAQTATVVSCPGASISPGLINAHEHLGWATAAPVSHEGIRYDHRHDWRRGTDGHDSLRYPGSDYDAAAVFFGELRHLMGGATSLAGAASGNDLAGFTRNLDNTSATDGIDVAVRDSTFPLGDIDGTLIESGCGYGGIDGTNVLNSDIYLPHISEGINPAARNEFACLSASTGGGNDVVEHNTSMIHGIGLTAADIAQVAADGAKLVWSPRTNIDLYGQTADIPTYSYYGVTIALGTDWAISGSSNMLREMQCADYLNEYHYDNLLTDRQIWLMGTRNGAVALGVGDQLGTLAEGYIADIAIFAGDAASPYRSVIDAEPADVALVMRGGEPIFGEADVVQGLVPAAEADGCEPIDVCGNARSLCATRDTGIDYATIRAKASYDPFYCGEPDVEPTCVPSRPGEYTGQSSADDRDGDGIADADDSCPAIFNPARPLGGGVQPDFDTDGIGDACDTCPLTDGEQCDPFDPNDRDGDGVANDADNCSGQPNADQADADADGTGDICDACPDYANPDGAACLATLYEVRDGTIGVGQAVLIEDAIVTAVDGTDGFFMQYPSDAAAYAGADGSGTFVYAKGTTPFPAVGDRIDIEASVDEFYSLVQLSSVQSITINSSGNTLPAPEVVDPAAVATGGSRATSLLGVLVQVDDVTVTAAPNQYNEFHVDSDLMIGADLYVVDPPPAVGDTIDAIIGPLTYSFSNAKILPRGPNDIHLGPPSLAGFSPSGQTVFLEAGATGATSPVLEVVLNRPTQQAMTIDLAYPTPSVLTGPASVQIAAGEQSAPLQLTGGQASATPATVTATVAADSFDARVRVYDAASTRSVVALDPAASTTQIGETVTLTVTLDLPAPAGGASVDLTSTGDITVPATMTVPAGQLSGDVDVTAGQTEGTATVTASLGGGQATATIDVTTLPSECLIIGEYIEGGGFDNKALELFNCGSSDLAQADYGVCQINNDGADCDYDALLPSGTLTSGAVLTMCNSKTADPNGTDPVTAITDNCQVEESSVINHNGDDRFLVYRDDDGSGGYSAGDTIMDAFGERAVNPPTDPWKDKTFRRCDFTPFDGSSFELARFTEHGKDDASDYGTPPTSPCP